MTSEKGLCSEESAVDTYYNAMMHSHVVSGVTHVYVLTAPYSAQAVPEGLRLTVQR